MSIFVVDVESDGPIIGINSIVCFGAIKVTEELNNTFYGQIKPMHDTWDPQALKISGFTREEHLKFPEPVVTMSNFYDWIIENNTHGQAIFISDNNGYDASWINYYFLRYSPKGKNPFGWSSRRIGDLYCGMMKDSRVRWKHLRKTKHTHNPVDDAKGNAEVLLVMKDLGLKIDFK